MTTWPPSSPSIRTIQQPRIDQIQYLRFKGDFTGTIHDFVTKGTVESNLGSLVTNLNMKLPAEGPSVYTGTIGTDSFYLGRFLDNDDLGRIAFQGKIDGTGLEFRLPLTQRSMERSAAWNSIIYTYQNIQVNGAVAKKKFNGEFLADDPNLAAHLNGLIDFTGVQPRFDFQAEVRKADLNRLNFVDKKVEFNGKFKCNFTGDDIDNFLGTASIYDASVYKNGERVSFDSLDLESSVVDNNKTITIVSNEFDGAIVGEFYIKDSPPPSKPSSINTTPAISNPPNPSRPTRTSASSSPPKNSKTISTCSIPTSRALTTPASAAVSIPGITCSTSTSTFLPSVTSISCSITLP